MLQSILRVLILAVGGGLLLSSSAFAQFTIPVSVLSNGASQMTGDNYGLQGTLGQSAIGVTTGDNHEMYQGFWFTVESITASEVDGPVVPATPTRFALMQNYPNPFNPATQIRFALPKASRVVFKVYNIQGALVETLAEHDFPAGEHQLLWNAGDHASGTYMVSMIAPGFAEVRKAVLLK